MIFFTLYYVLAIFVPVILYPVLEMLLQKDINRFEFSLINVSKLVGRPEFIAFTGTLSIKNIGAYASGTQIESLQLSLYHENFRLGWITLPRAVISEDPTNITYEYVILCLAEEENCTSYALSFAQVHTLFNVKGNGVFKKTILGTEFFYPVTINKSLKVRHYIIKISLFIFNLVN
jgi:hypothetical protein